MVVIRYRGFSMLSLVHLLCTVKVVPESFKSQRIRNMSFKLVLERQERNQIQRYFVAKSRWLTQRGGKCPVQVQRKKECIRSGSDSEDSVAVDE
jgi:hypothetical protein